MMPGIAIHTGFPLAGASAARNVPPATDGRFSGALHDRPKTATQTQPCCAQLAGTHFTGKQDSTKAIVGTYGTFDLRFERSITPLCN